MRNDFAVFILSHGRANNVKTLETLKKCNYKGKTYIIIDNEDEQKEEYRKLKCTDVIIFNKSEIIENTDTIDNFKDHRLVVYARNKCWDIAKELKLNYFLVLDDDYNEIGYRYIDKNGVFKHDKNYLQNADNLFNACIEFLETSEAITVALAQSGDYIGGANAFFYKGLSRKAMNSFFCKTNKPFKFLGSTNEDVNMYITYGQKGYKIFTITNVYINQSQTQQNSGGLTDIYLDNGTYIKSFYSVICAPSCAKVAAMGDNHLRIHHQISWNNCCPKIISEKYKRK